MRDILDVLQSQTTSTATVNGNWLDLTTQPGTQREGLAAFVNIQAHSAPTPGATVQYSLQWSTDGTNLGGTLYTAPAVTPGVTPTNIIGGVGYLEISLPFSLGPTGEYVRVVGTFSNTTGAPSITWSSDLVYGWPG